MLCFGCCSTSLKSISADARAAPDRRRERRARRC